MMNLLTAVLLCILLVACQAKLITLDPEASTTLKPIAPTENVTLSGRMDDFNEALAFGDHVVYAVAKRLGSLPEEMIPIGEKILADTREGVRVCEINLRENRLIWEYKVCCSSYLRYSMMAYAGLGQGSTDSGAGRPTLLFF